MIAEVTLPDHVKRLEHDLWIVPLTADWTDQNDIVNDMLIVQQGSVSQSHWVTLLHPCSEPDETCVTRASVPTFRMLCCKCKRRAATRDSSPWDHSFSCFIPLSDSYLHMSVISMGISKDWELLTFSNRSETAPAEPPSRGPGI